MALSFLIFAGYRGFLSIHKIRQENLTRYLDDNKETPKTTGKKITIKKSIIKSSVKKVRKVAKISSPVPINNDFQRIVNMMEDGQYNEALKLLTEIWDSISTTTDEGTALYLLGEVSFRMNNYMEAARYYAQFIRDYPEHPGLNNAKAALEFLGSG